MDEPRNQGLRLRQAPIGLLRRVGRRVAQGGPPLTDRADNSVRLPALFLPAIYSHRDHLRLAPTPRLCRRAAERMV